MPKSKQQQTDHDILIRLDEKFEIFTTQYALDIKSLKDNVTKDITSNKLKLDAHDSVLKKHEERLDKMDKEKDIKDGKANLLKVIAGAIGGFIMFLLTQLPNILRNWGIIN